MASMEFCGDKMSFRTLRYTFPLLVLLQFLIAFAQGQGPGSVCGNVASERFSIREGRPGGTTVGSITTQSSYTYSFKEPQTLFELHPTTGEITTKVELDREALTTNPIQILVIPRSMSGTTQQCPTDVFITVLDVNDNSPTFPYPSIQIRFNENVNVGYQQQLTSATDIDQGNFGTITSYTIINMTDSANEKFTLIYDIDQYGYSPLIRAIGGLDREVKDFYQLWISCQDGGDPPRYGYLQVNITIADYNDNAPQFSPSQYVASINESVPVGTSVIKVEATDKDIGENGDISYRITDDTQQFTINSKTGEISTTVTPLKCTRRCDRSINDACEPSSCMLTIEVEDAGRPPLSGRAYVTVNVKDENNNVPEMKVTYLPSGSLGYSTIDENASNGTNVAIISVSDSDTGSYGTISDVRIIGGNDYNHFFLQNRLNNQLEFLKVNGNGVLDRERIEKYNITIMAADGGIPPKTSLKSILVYIKDVNDHHPMFPKTQYRVSLSETVPVSTYVTSLTAIDLDTGDNAKLSYAIISGNELKWFKIDANSGLVTTQALLRYELQTQVVMNISVHDGSLNPLYNFTSLIVTISDENDITPTFEHQIYNASIAEGLQTGSKVINVTARDYDSAPNGTVTYSLHHDVSERYPATFNLDPNSGIITTLKVLDREVIAYYVIRIIARDGGTPAWSSTATVNINVDDINDSIPRFYPVTYYAQVLENKPIGTSVVRVFAEDPDYGSNGTVYYSFNGNYPQFSVDQNTGLITTAAILNRATQSTYSLSVKATDARGRTNVQTASVDVVVTDQSVTPPVFRNNVYNFSIVEDPTNMPVNSGRTVGTVQADTANAGVSISYGIVDGDPNSVFVINSATGKITNNKRVDREERAQYDLKVIATAAGLFGEATVRIIVSDINDNIPKFTSSVAEAQAVENWPVGHDVYLAKATDADAGPNAQISYRLQSTPDMFNVIPTTGMIFLAKPIDKSNVKTFVVNVIASDGGAPQLSSTVRVEIEVIDVNDHTPVFSHSNYEVSLNESLAVNSQFFTLTATDDDSGRNGQVTYNITSGNAERKFGIFPDGKLFLARMLDRETKDHYKLTITAKDMSVEQRSSSANVSIYILDDNDKRPLFDNASYLFGISENQPAGTVVGMVKATDLDIGRNAELSYYLDQNQDNFTIDAQTGEISSLRPFDREYLNQTMGRTSYTFSVYVTDNGLQRLTDSVMVVVNVLDVNDNPPQFKDKVYRASLLEDAAENTRVLKIGASDNDTNENAALSYLIVDGNADGRFKISAGNGQIYLSGGLDRENQDSYALTIIASDSGKDVQYTATTTVSITVLDVNDNAPLFDQTAFDIGILETTQLGEEIAHFTATDTDLGENAQITYKVTENGGMFNIDRNTGKLYLEKALDYEKKSEYHLNISAEDKGRTPLPQYARLTVRVLDANDNAPDFGSTPAFVTVSEDVGLYNNILKVTATDPDAGNNGKVVYSLKSQDPPGDHFKIDTSSGYIYISSILDRESSPTFTLKVIASDSALPSLSKSTEKEITVFVSDINDNDPEFLSMDAIALPYPAGQGAFGNVLAVDPDNGSNGTVVYELAQGDQEKFSLHETTGELSLRKNIGQTPVTYSLRVIARDSGIPSSRSTHMDITIILVGTSGGPTFLGQPYKGQISENRPAGTDILTVETSPTALPTEYYITGITSKETSTANYFKVNKIDGSITSSIVLDREIHGDNFTVEVCALEKQNSGPKATRTQVVITVSDINDTPPMFSRSVYTVSVLESLPVGREVTRVSVTDQDLNGQVTLSITAGNVGNSFSVDQNGVVTVANRLDRETLATYDLTLSASDGINNSQSTVTISVTDVNDDIPSFNSALYTFDLPEDMAPHTTIGRVDATDNDLGVNGGVSYTLLTQFGGDMFDLDPNQGTFTLKSQLDFEQMQLYVLTVEARDHGDPSLSSTVSVFMNVKDINDNSPTFDPASFSTKIFENVTVDSSIITVSASDSDSGVNGEVRYRITGGDLYDQFSINMVTGEVTTIRPLDREVVALYSLEVTATDQAVPHTVRNTATTKITVIVEDVNDSYPKFVSPSQIWIKENAQVGDVVAMVTAEDQDEGGNGLVYYSTTSTNLPFTIENIRGKLSVTQTLDRENVPQYTMNVKATDNGIPQRSTDQTLIIHLEDVNDNRPVFSQAEYTSTVQENITVGSTILTVHAQDADSGTNGLVRYFIIAGEDNSDFSVDQSTGVLRVKKNLDFERRTFYDITIQAEDSSSDTKSAQASVKIAVTDINDNAPVFVNSPYKPIVLENATPPVRVIIVSARDDDSSPYNKVAYSFLGGNDEKIFHINESSGEITCNKSLDREVITTYQLVVRGKDYDHPGPLLTGTGTVIVTVADVNDNSPIFEHSGTYVGHILENEDPMTSILTVQATDADNGLNGQVTYRLENNIENKFMVNPATGVVSTTQALDREEVDPTTGHVLDQYNLKVIASDGGFQPHFTMADIVIYVDDVNDNDPMFLRPTYTQVVNNPTTAGGFVLGVTAVDQDTSSNGRVTYRLTGTNADRFVIDADRGIITAAQAITLTGARYSCSVEASDKGSESRKSSVNIEVTVASANSDKPTFNNVPDNLRINENVVMGFPLTSVSAASPIGRNIFYHIAGGNVANTFTINDQTGDITVGNQVDYEIASNFQLWVEARVTGNPTLSSYAAINVDVTDLNDNTPRFSYMLYSHTISENQPTITSVIKVSASDADDGENGRITYSIQDGDPHNNFTIDTVTGVIRTRTTLDREVTDTVNLIIYAVDHGSSSNTGSTTVRITILDQNDNPPVFKRQFSATINEDIDVGVFILQVTTVDADIGINANVSYTMTHDKFTIDALSGNISSNSALDLEDITSTFYMLDVKATDGYNDVVSKVIIYLKDVNDKIPIFQPQNPTFTFPERQPSGTPIGTVTALDADRTSPNNEVYYTLKYPSKAVVIHPTNGGLSSKRELVYQQNITATHANVLEVVVIATDLGTPPLSSETMVKINVLDANDHAPIFEKSSYFSAVPVTVGHGARILQVKATDSLDVGVNAEVEFFMVSGNGSGYFTVDTTTGFITVAAVLDADKQDADFILMVEARDKGTPVMSSVTTVRLRITGVNLHAPVFVTTVFEVTVDENMAIGREIANISATDADVTGPNGRVQYSIASGNPDNLFALNSVNGALTIEKALDYETTMTHYLNITVRDQGLLYKEISRTFTVFVRDVNDQVPVFNQTQYDAYIPENSPSGERVIKVTATDADTGIHADIEYYLDDTSRFSIESKTGIIRSQGQLDYESQSLYTVTVMAINPGTTKKGSTNIHIHLTGVNEYFPQFMQNEYSFTITESVADGSPVGSVHANDNDQGEDGVVYYYLIGSSNTKGFKINYSSGLITVSGRPDYESSPQIDLKVLAKNWGSVQGNDTDQCTVTIKVTDANDAPVFNESVYRASVKEGSGGGVSVTQVFAIDNDNKQSDPQFYYTILGGNLNDAFVVDRVTGMVRTSGSGNLDREVDAMYNITVGAVDSGVPPQTGSATVQITLEDINDNAPYFDPVMPVGYIRENSAIGSSVMMLLSHTFDKDLPPNSGSYTYKTVAGDDYNFSISPTTGLIQTKAAIDREQNLDFSIPVVVSESGILNKLSATLTFHVIVEDVNDESPLPRNMAVQIAVMDGDYPIMPVADVHPLDRDTIGQYQCWLQSDGNSIFEIPSESCDLRIRNKPTASRYTLDVTGSDGLNSPNANYTVSVNMVAIDNNTLQNTVIIRIEDITPRSFLENSYTLFLTSLSQLSVGDTVLMFHLTSLGDDMLVFVAIQRSDGSYVLADILKDKIANNLAKIEADAGISITTVGYSVCGSTTCASDQGGKCVNQIAVGTGASVADSSYQVITSPSLTLGYYCICPPNMSGDTCTQTVEKCGGDYCQNAGTCVNDNFGNPVCACVPGWTGTYCASDVPECNSKPCLNGGQCVESPGSYSCRCPDGFYGDHCEIGQDHCKNTPCRNGGTCRNQQEGRVCDCPFTYWGDSCESTSVGFEEGSYMKFSFSSVQYNKLIDVTFSTLRSNALLLYNPAVTNNKFVALEIIGGFIQFSFNIGTSTSQTIKVKVNKNVSTGQWFRVKVTRAGQRLDVHVQDCPANGEECQSCEDGNSFCHGYDSQNAGNLYLGGELSIGGIGDITEITSRNQIVTHDFIGCIKNFYCNDSDLITRSGYLAKVKVKDTCPRSEGKSVCTGIVCSNGGVCVDEWSTARCRCPEKYSGTFCQIEVKPLGFGANTIVQFTQRESYYRDSVVGTATNRKRRATDTSSVFIRFRTTAQNGLLFYASQNSDYSALLSVIEGRLQYSILKQGIQTVQLLSVQVSDGNWYNVTISVTGTQVSLTVQGSPGTTKDLTSAFLFSDPKVTTLALGGDPSSSSSNGDVSRQGFGGCISVFRLDNQPITLNGTTDRFVVVPSSGVENGCSALCSDSPCGDRACTPVGEEVQCGPTVDDAAGIGIGVIVVIAFFGVLIIVIVAVFIFCRIRRRQQNKSKSGNAKMNGNAHVNKNFTDNSAHSHQDSGYGDHPTEEDFISSHIDQGLTARRNQPNRPDIISSDRQHRKQFPLEIDDGTVIIDNGDAINMHMTSEDIPEHYDIDNASSIAPSDIDVVAHYRDYRGVNKHPYPHHSHLNNIHNKPHNKHSSRHGPSPQTVPGHGRSSAPIRESPSPYGRQGMTHSPALLDPSQLHNSACNSPAVQGARNSPMNHLSRQSPHMRYSPLTNPNVRGTPLSDHVHHSRTDSEHSLASHHSHSSSSSVARPPSLPQGHPSQLRGNPVKVQPPQPRQVKGLTYGEVKKLNTRPQPPSPESMVEMVSSSSASHGHHPPYIHNSSVLEAPDSSSEESANDSFTCSEFEYENERPRNDFDSSNLILSKLAEVENENQDYNSHNNNNHRKFISDGRTSNGDSFGSSEDGPANGAKPINGTFNWDEFLNWGPSFEKLVGVFRDIASLPDGDNLDGSPEIEVHQEEEEYV
ncbi:cadherin-related tumor suppressor-like [Mizuhopecten yessoensis]|uniref:Cadherin-related tumor suppressor n=1 Tax=Mizuhopecten yessoensis TaxID=6573 RepID=A0A210QQS7_MIZYE|nr:cadherin-related tumor suppressor-like [Mizuhopecten yessoensis]OWF51064.1 Cadherin-related tumor suppressor [Mizuhopecten yessoensis]